MRLGTLHGIGVGPGDPDLLTLKGASILARCEEVFVPKADRDGGSLALSIARAHLRPDARIHELVFPMIGDDEELDRRWNDSARQVCEILQRGQDACFLTLGDPLLYSTYVYLLRAVRRRLPDAPAVTVPGVMAFAAAAALAEFPLGEGKTGVSIVPTADDLGAVERALSTGQTVVLMKIGPRLDSVLRLLEAQGAIERAVLVARAGLDGQRVETDLRRLRDGEAAQAGYLSVVLLKPSREQGR